MIPFLGKHSIRQKLFTGMLVSTLSALLIFGTALIAYDLRDYHGRRLEDLATQGRLIGLTVAPALQFEDQAVAASSLTVLSVRPSIFAAAVYDAKGELFATYSLQEKGSGANNADFGADSVIDAITGVYPESEPEPERGADGVADAEPAASTHAFPDRPETDGYRIDGDRLHLFRGITHNGERLGTLYIEGRYQLYDRLWQYAGIVLGAAVLALVFSMLVSLRMQKQLSRPLLGITSLARTVTEQRNYSLRAEKLTNDEIGFLVDAFNDLLAEVEHGSAALELSNTQLQQEISDRRLANEEIRDLNARLEQRVIERTGELERANRELEAFSYSVSHDLRAPLRAIDGFSQALLEDYSEQLDAAGQNYLDRVRAAAQRMGRLIDDLLKLARVSRASINQEPVDLSMMAEEIVDDLRSAEPARAVDIRVAPGLVAFGDAHLLRIALENLLSNAWKYTAKCNQAGIDIGREMCGGRVCYFVRDNGAGFDMAYAGKLFGAFQRLHEARDYPGTGVGLATVQRIIHRHGGEIWADAVVDVGAVFYFTLPMKADEEGQLG